MPESKLRDAVRTSSYFAAFFALVAFARAMGAVLVRHAPTYGLLLAPALAYAVFFVLAFGLQVSGAVTRDLKVNRWFAWSVCGGFVFFWVGLFIRGHDVLAEDAPTVGLYSALAWVVLVQVVWLVSRLFARRGA